jgi:NADH:ubiquinone oxidoreductase subunit F (NADH-binding)
VRVAAAELKLPIAAVHGAATFYDDLAQTRRGARHVRVCEGTACFAADEGRHIGQVEQALGVSAGSCSEDGSVSLQAVRCIGFCYAAPALLDGTVPHAGPKLADRLARGTLNAPGIPVAALSQPVVLAGILAGEDPWQHWPNVVASWPPQRLIAELEVSGLRGRGGAEFPVAAKWSAAAAGLFGAPTAVNNVETLASVPWIVARGGAAFARLGSAPETGTKLVCLNEAFAAPGAYEVELGTPIRTIVEELGGGLCDVRRLRSVQIGGPLGGFLGPDELDVPLLDSALTGYGVALGHASLIAIDDRIPAAELLRHVWRFAALESCGTCAPCRIGSGRGLALAARVVAGDASALAEQQPLLATLETASMCAFGRGVPASIRSLLRVYADELPT